MATMDNKHKIDLGAYIIIDMINDFTSEDGALYVPDSNKTVSNIVDKLRKIRSGEIECERVFFVNDCHDENDIEFEKYPPHAIRGTKGANLNPRIKEYFENRNWLAEIVRPLPGKYIEKQKFSAFQGTHLDRMLSESTPMGTPITLAGVCTDICILATAIDAVCKGYRVNIFDEDVMSFDKEGHKAALKILKEKFKVNVILTEEKTKENM